MEERWYVDDKSHRIGGPAITIGSFNPLYTVDEAQIPSLKEDGFLSKYHDRSKLYQVDQCWYINGKKHREDGPAVVKHLRPTWYATDLVPMVEEWWLNDQLHKDDGPAIIKRGDQLTGRHDIEYYYLHGCLCESPATHRQLMGEMVLKKKHRKK
jgi:hypothetical protein